MSTGGFCFTGNDYSQKRNYNWVEYGGCPLSFRKLGIIHPPAYSSCLGVHVALEWENGAVGNPGFRNLPERGNCISLQQTGILYFSTQHNINLYIDRELSELFNGSIPYISSKRYPPSHLVDGFQTYDKLHPAWRLRLM